MNTINEVITALTDRYKPKSLMVREERDILTITCNGSITRILNWKTTPLSEIVVSVGGQTLTEGYSGELLLG
jgi:hypothetical protein